MALLVPLIPAPASVSDSENEPPVGFPVSETDCCSLFVRPLPNRNICGTSVLAYCPANSTEIGVPGSWPPVTITSPGLIEVSPSSAVRTTAAVASNGIAAVLLPLNRSRNVPPVIWLPISICWISFAAGMTATVGPFPLLSAA